VRCPPTQSASVLSSGNKSLVWVAAILSVPGESLLRPLTVTKSGSGTGTVSSVPSGIACGSTCTAAFEVNRAVTLTATASSGSVFTGWNGEPDFDTSRTFSEAVLNESAGLPP